jgi:amino-acid N-acetyltransferase
MARALTLRSAADEPDGVAYVERLLRAAELPADDVGSKPDCFYVGYDGDRVGVGGIERRGTEGLLRSVVVEPSARGGGVGAALCAALEDRARQTGVGTLYLLTTDAAGFFERRGYAEIERSEAPAGIKATTQFEELCPATATALRKSL